jgi:3-methyladenine DNA glycosylase AlkD
VRSVRRNVTRLLKSADATSVFNVATVLLSDGDVPKWFVYELVHYHADTMAKLNLKKLSQLAQGIASWGEVDALACYVSGPAWREGRISDVAIHRWARSPDRWRRRAAVVSTVALNNTARGGQGDAARTLSVCDLVKLDRDDMVVKGLSWALRELAAKKPAAVRGYIDARRDVLAPRVLREVKNKLTTGVKNPKKSGAHLRGVKMRVGDSHDRSARHAVLRGTGVRVAPSAVPASHTY